MRRRLRRVEVAHGDDVRPGHDQDELTADGTVAEEDDLDVAIAEICRPYRRKTAALRLVLDDLTGVESDGARLIRETCITSLDDKGGSIAADIGHLARLALKDRECQRVGRCVMSEERKLAVLRAIVEDYVATHEPVGSRTLVERHSLGVSPATVRNDMALLEEEGLIAQPHTSAGRIPTDKGYRLFVDKLSTVRTLTTAERRAIETFMEGAVDVDDVVQRSVRVLAQLTNQVAIVQYPSLTRSTVRHIELVPLEGAKILIVVITSSGRVEQRIIELESTPSEQLVSSMRSRITQASLGQRLPEASLRLADIIDQFARPDRPIVTAIVTTLAQTFSNERSDERIAVGGTANLARFGADFDTAIRPVLEALEEQVVLLRLLGEATSPSLMTVRIGSETGYQELATTSVVASAYGSDDEALATLGTVGPMRMDYPGTMAAVGAVARYVGRTISEG
ncbi:MAG: heat-inducible transcriptional repressor HrcA [Nocardioidaceae bacterium]|nr:heat-inducible transcriptional repressor HrcA [Nocardioidaceae bacterium]